MTSRLKWILIGATVVAVVVSGIITWNLFESTAPEILPSAPSADATANFSAGQAPGASANVNQGTKTTAALLATDSPSAQLERQVMDFVARFGTFSTDFPNENLRELLPQMGADLKAWATARLNAKPTIVPYQGITTKAVSVTVKQKNGNNYEMEVSTQRTVTDVAGTRVRYEIAAVTVSGNAQNWLVDRVVFTEKK